MRSEISPNYRQNPVIQQYDSKSQNEPLTAHNNGQLNPLRLNYDIYGYYRNIGTVSVIFPAGHTPEIGKNNPSKTPR